MIVQSESVGTLLERLATLIDEKKRLEAETKAVNKEIEKVESLALELMAASGIDGVKAAGKTWYTQEWFGVSVPAENRDKVLEIARRECPEYIGVNTSSLKGWLKERRSEGSESLAAGTPFAGLVEEWRTVRLSHRTLG